MEGPDEKILAWLEALDELTYYDLFAISPDATPDEIQAAFHVFCDTFHPDRHVTRSEDERVALGTIFKRGTEAYAVLSDDAMRGHYDAQLVVVGSSVPPPRLSLSPHSRPPPSRGPGAAVPLEEQVRAPSARPFARRADELLRSGDVRQAKLQLVMANHMDPDNPALEAALRDVEAKLSSPK